MRTPTIVASREHNPRVLRQKLDSAMREIAALEERCAEIEGVLRQAHGALTGDMDWAAHDDLVLRIRVALGGRV